MPKADWAACAVLLNRKPDNVDLPQNTTLLERIHPRCKFGCGKLAGLLPINARTLSGVTRRENPSRARRGPIAGSLSIEPFEGSRPDLAGQLLIGYSIGIVIRSGAVLLHSGWLASLQLPCQILSRASVRRASGFVHTR
jgi:hypothetical protein